MQCSSCRRFFTDGCCACTHNGYGCAQTVRRLSFYDQSIWKCASCKTLASGTSLSPFAGVPALLGTASSNPVTLEAVLKEVQGLRSEIYGLPAIHVNAIKEEIYACKFEVTRVFDSIKKDVKNLEAKLDTIQNDISMLHSQSEQSISQLKAADKLNDIRIINLSSKMSSKADLSYSAIELGNTITKINRDRILKIQEEISELQVADNNREIVELTDIILELKNSMQNDNALFKTQISNSNKTIIKDLFDLQAARELTDKKILEISHMISSLAADIKILTASNTSIKSNITQILCSEWDIKKEIGDLKLANDKYNDKLNELADNLSEISDNTSIENGITLISSQVSESEKAIKKEISNLKPNKFNNNKLFSTTGENQLKTKNQQIEQSGIFFFGDSIKKMNQLTSQSSNCSEASQPKDGDVLSQPLDRNEMSQTTNGHESSQLSDGSVTSQPSNWSETSQPKEGDVLSQPLDRSEMSQSTNEHEPSQLLDGSVTSQPSDESVTGQSSDGSVTSQSSDESVTSQSSDGSETSQPKEGDKTSILNS